MSLTGMVVLYGHQMLRKIDHSQAHYFNSMFETLDLSKAVSQLSQDVWQASSFTSLGEKAEIALNDHLGSPMVYYFFTDSLLMRTQGEYRDTLQTPGIGKPAVSRSGISFYDSLRQFRQVFLTPEQSVAVR